MVLFTRQGGMNIASKRAANVQYVKRKTSETQG